MAFEFPISRGAARLAALAVIAGSFCLPLGVADAAPLRGQGFFNDRPPAAGAAPFNVDPTPCGQGRPQARNQGSRMDCPDMPPRRDRSGNGPRRPGPSAFGLQFDPYGY